MICCSYIGVFLIYVFVPHRNTHDFLSTGIGSSITELYASKSSPKYESSSSSVDAGNASDLDNCLTNCTSEALGSNHEGDASDENGEAGSVKGIDSASDVGQESEVDQSPGDDFHQDNEIDGEVGVEDNVILDDEDDELAGERDGYAYFKKLSKLAKQKRAALKADQLDVSMDFVFQPEAEAEKCDKG